MEIKPFQIVCYIVNPQLYAVKVVTYYKGKVQVDFINNEDLINNSIAKSINIKELLNGDRSPFRKRNTISIGSKGEVDSVINGNLLIACEIANQLGLYDKKHLMLRANDFNVYPLQFNND